MRQARSTAISIAGLLVSATAAVAAGPWELRETLPFRYGPLACDLGEATAASVDCAWSQEETLTFAGSCRLEITGDDDTRAYRAEAVVNPVVVDMAQAKGLTVRDSLTYAFGGISCGIEVPAFMGYSCQAEPAALSCRVCLYLFGYCVTAEGVITEDAE